jgi:hypothetical protein
MEILLDVKDHLTIYFLSHFKIKKNFWFQAFLLVFLGELMK